MMSPFLPAPLNAEALLLPVNILPSASFTNTCLKNFLVKPSSFSAVLDVYLKKGNSFGFLAASAVSTNLFNCSSTWLTLSKGLPALAAYLTNKSLAFL